MFAIWALPGLCGALGPALVQALTGSDDVVLGRLSLTVLTAFGAVAIVVPRNAPARMMMLAGIGSLVLGVAVTLLALMVRSAALFSTAGENGLTAFGRLRHR